MLLSLSDEDFGKLVSGKTQAQRLFMSGKLKIKGDVMKVCSSTLPTNEGEPGKLTGSLGNEDGTGVEEGTDKSQIIDG